MVEFKRKKGESFEGFLRRFNRTLIKSRKLNEVRSRKFLQSKKNKNEQKAVALNTIKIRAEKEYQKRIGKLKEDTRGRW